MIALTDPESMKHAILSGIRKRIDRFLFDVIGDFETGEMLKINSTLNKFLPCIIRQNRASRGAR